MHAHASDHGNKRATRILRFSLVVTLAYIVLLVVAGVRSHSLALLSEAGHNLSDFFALLLSLIAVYLQSRPPSATKTYGYHRAGVLAALANAASLVAVSVLIFYEAFRRWRNPQQVHAEVMIGVAAAGVVMNGVIAVLLYRTGRDVNLRSAFLHEIGDTLSTADIPPSVSERILRDVRGCLHTEFHIDHTTIQFEHSVCEVAHGCVIPVTEQH